MSPVALKLVIFVVVAGMLSAFVAAARRSRLTFDFGGRNRLDEARRCAKCCLEEMEMELWAYRDFIRMI